MAILVIDDEAGLRRSLSAYLEDMDYETLLAANGREGSESRGQRRSLPVASAARILFRQIRRRYR